MKTKLAILLCALIGFGALLNQQAEAGSISISIGDRPYYHGAPYFWDYGWYYVWVPGHWRHGRWIHGYYVRRGDWNGRYLRHRHNWHNWRY